MNQHDFPLTLRSTTIKVSPVKVYAQKWKDGGGGPNVRVHLWI